MNLLMREVLLKYKFLDANIIHERNKLINDEKLHNEICNMLANQWQNQSLTQPIVCSSLGGNNKLCSIVDEKLEVMGQSPYWVWSKAQLQVNQRRVFHEKQTQLGEKLLESAKKKPEALKMLATGKIPQYNFPTAPTTTPKRK